MNILLVLVPISIVLLVVAIGAFVWAVRRGQFDNLDSAALDVLTDDRAPHRERDAGVGAAMADDTGDSDHAPPKTPSADSKQRGN